MPPDDPDVLIRKAKQDELVLERLLLDTDVDDDTLGFHAQQSVPIAAFTRDGHETLTRPFSGLISLDQLPPSSVSSAKRARLAGSARS